ncbi:MAG: S49 family peptidase [Leptospirillia bacterium]
MPNWNSLLDEIRVAGGTHDLIRRKYLSELHNLTGRNVILYYSGWLHAASYSTPTIASSFFLDDNDKNGFMAAIHQLDRSKGLDLILHTPGGDIAATESLVAYLREMFDGNIRAIIPQLAMSAGTMIALSCNKIIMGKHSSLGPIDPQISGIPAHGVIEEVNTAKADISQVPALANFWHPIISKYSPAFIGECQKAITWAEEVVKYWLITGMYSGQKDPRDKANKVFAELGDHALTKSHSRHISANQAIDLIGDAVTLLEDNDELQEAVLTVHHACIQTLAENKVIKIIENHAGTAFITKAS